VVLLEEDLPAEDHALPVVEAGRSRLAPVPTCSSLVWVLLITPYASRLLSSAIAVDEEEDDTRRKQSTRRKQARVSRQLQKVTQSHRSST
jgi:hypothetical protein